MVHTMSMTEEDDWDTLASENEIRSFDGTGKTEHDSTVLVVVCRYVVVVVFFTLTDRASTIPNNTRGCQSGTWSAGQKKIRGTSTKLQ